MRRLAAALAAASLLLLLAAPALAASSGGAGGKPGALERAAEAIKRAAGAAQMDASTVRGGPPLRAQAEAEAQAGQAQDDLAALRKAEGGCPPLMAGAGEWFACRLRQGLEAVAASLFTSVQLLAVMIVAAFVGTLFPAIEALTGGTAYVAPNVQKAWTTALIIGLVVFAFALALDAFRAVRGGYTAGQLGRRAAVCLAALALGAGSLFLIDFMIYWQNQFVSAGMMTVDQQALQLGPADQPRPWRFARLLVPQAAGGLDAAAGDGPKAAIITAVVFFGGRGVTGGLAYSSEDWKDVFLRFDTGGAGLLLTLALLFALAWLGVAALLRALALHGLAVLGPVAVLAAPLGAGAELIAGYFGLVARAVLLQGLVGTGLVLIHGFAARSGEGASWLPVKPEAAVVLGLSVLCWVSWRWFVRPTADVIRSGDITLGGARIMQGLGRAAEWAGGLAAAWGYSRGHPSLLRAGARARALGSALHRGAEERTGEEEARRQEARARAGETFGRDAVASRVRSLIAAAAKAEEAAAPAGAAARPAPSGAGAIRAAGAAPAAAQAAAWAGTADGGEEGTPPQPAWAYALGRRGVIGGQAEGVKASALGWVRGRVSPFAAAQEKAARYRGLFATARRGVEVGEETADQYGRRTVRVRLPSVEPVAAAVARALGAGNLPRPAAGAEVAVPGSKREVEMIVAHTLTGEHRAALARAVFAWRTPSGKLVVQGEEGGYPVPRVLSEEEISGLGADLHVVGEWPEEAG